MTIIQNVRCPNCGSLAERFHFPLLTQVKTECQACDYLMVTCSRTGLVIEAYAPGISSEGIELKQRFRHASLKKASELYQERHGESNGCSQGSSKGFNIEGLVNFRSSTLRRLSLYTSTKA